MGDFDRFDFDKDSHYQDDGLDELIDIAMIDYLSNDDPSLLDELGLNIFD